MGKTISYKIELDSAEASRKVADFQKAAKSLGFSGGAEMAATKPRLAESVAASLGISLQAALAGLSTAMASDPRIGNWAQKFQQQFTREAAKRIEKMGDISKQGASPIPPRIADVMRKNILTGVAGFFAGFVSPWIGGRLMSQASGGMFGGKTGGLLGHIFGAGGPLGFSVAYLEAVVRTKLLKAAISEMAKAMEAAADVFKRSAATARPMGQIFQIGAAFKQVGLSEAIADRMLTQARIPSQGRRTFGAVPSVNAMLAGSSGTLSVQEMNQVRNLAPQIERALKDAAFDSYLMAENAGKLYELQFQMNALTREWRSMWATVAGEFAPYLAVVIRSLITELKGAILLLKTWMDFMMITPPGMTALVKEMQKGPGQSFTPVGSPQKGGPWEKMGFIIGGTSATEYTKRIANNTGELVRILRASTNSTWGSGMPSNNNFNAP